MTCKPSEINTKEHFWDSGFQKSEYETVARVLVWWLSQNGDTFDRWFTYEEVSKNIVSPAHLSMIDKWLLIDGNKYRVTPDFIRIVSRFRKGGAP